MRKQYIKVESIKLTKLSHAEFINFMERFLALLPLEAEEDDSMGAPKVGITVEQIEQGRNQVEDGN